MVPSPRFPRRAGPALLLAWAAVLLALPLEASAAPAGQGGGLFSVAAGRWGFRGMRIRTQMVAIYHHRPVAAGLRPAGGILAAHDGASFLFGGLSSDVAPFDGWGLTPMLSAGWYSSGDGQDLGGPLEFRSAIELWMRAGRGTRVGLCLDHLSNAGLFDDNPGRESLSLTITSLR